MLRKNTGFTLFELAVVISIIGILSALVVPTFLTQKEGRVVRGLVENLAGDMQLARMQSMREGPIAVVFDTSSYQIFIDKNQNFTVDTGERLIKKVDFSPGIKIYDNGFPYKSIHFDNRGIPNIQGKPVQVTYALTIRGNSENEQKKLFLNPIGRVWVEY